MRPTQPINPQYYVATRDTRWDVYPQREPAQIIAHDWWGFWDKTKDGQWFRTPTSYNFTRPATSEEIAAWRVL